MGNTNFETLFTAEEINRFRADTPACLEKIHFNNAGASLMPTIVKQEIINYIELESKMGGYEAADKEISNIDTFYDSAANLLNCTAGEIAFTANATDSFSRALSSIPFKKDDVILTTNEDYISNQISYLAFQY
jgi:selenocysteine lyase/cysteine desulfurase